MNISEIIKNIHKEVISWRRELHANPELSYEENWTSEFISEKLKSFGMEVCNVIGKTGVIGILQGSGSQINKSKEYKTNNRSFVSAKPVLNENNIS